MSKLYKNWPVYNLIAHPVSELVDCWRCLGKRKYMILLYQRGIEDE
jgi:hypothetical protein